MKIGIITSWMETLALFRFLTRYNHEYIIYFDSLNAPYWEKHFESSLKNIKKGIDYLKEKWVDTIILPPCYELSLIEKEPLVLPLFKTYLFQEVFTYSLVGKLGLAWEYADLEKGQELIENLAKNYQPSLTQKTTKKFSYPFHYRSKEMGILNPLLTRLSWKSLLTNTLIKQEFRYFKDANVDTVIPLNYLYFNGERTLSKFLNFKKIRFHKLEKLEKIFTELVNKESKYEVQIHATDQKDFLLREKRMIWLLQRGKSVSIQRL